MTNINVTYKMYEVFSFTKKTCHCILDQWKNMSKALTSAGHSLVAVQDNLIDVVWTDRPERPSTQLRTLGLDYTGECKTGLT